MDSKKNQSDTREQTPTKPIDAEAQPEKPPLSDDVRNPISEREREVEKREHGELTEE